MDQDHQIFVSIQGPGGTGAYRLYSYSKRFSSLQALNSDPFEISNSLFCSLLEMIVISIRVIGEFLKLSLVMIPSGSRMYREVLILLEF